MGISSSSGPCRSMSGTGTGGEHVPGFCPPRAGVADPARGPEPAAVEVPKKFPPLAAGHRPIPASTPYRKPIAVLNPVAQWAHPILARPLLWHRLLASPEATSTEGS